MTASPPFVSTVFDELTHQVTAFNCGEPDLDAWLKDHATSAAAARVARTFVWLDAPGQTVVAYYALSAHAVPRAQAPSRISRGVPDPVPAALLAKLALDTSWQRQGLGAVLLADALSRIIDSSQSGPAVRAIVVDASSESGRRLYEQFGFVKAPGREDRMIARAETIARGLGRP